MHLRAELVVEGASALAILVHLERLEPLDLHDGIQAALLLLALLL